MASSFLFLYSLFLELAQHIFPVRLHVGCAIHASSAACDAVRCIFQCSDQLSYVQIMAWEVLNKLLVTECPFIYKYLVNKYGILNYFLGLSDIKINC